ncbi:MAG: dihydrodipicolinate synthase family protein [Alphaproteobacteria bacterium]|nr:dihydrodipicolinate synthase family protein [Alphaproteobacteria bacterium]
MSNVLHSLRGVSPIVMTPFDERNRIDFDSYEREVEWLIAGGLKAMGLGLASELKFVTEEERLSLVKALARFTKGRVKIFAGTGADDAALAIERSHAALEEGFDMLLVTPPKGPDEDGIYRYYEAISKAIRAPIIVQDAFNNTHVRMSADLIARLGDIEHVRAAKLETAPTPTAVREIKERVGDKLMLIGGMGSRYTIDEWRRGAEGTIPGPATGLLVFKPIWDHLQKGEVGAARRWLRRFDPLMHWGLVDNGRFHYLEKELMRRKGIFRTTAFRADLPHPAPFDIAELEDYLAFCEIHPDGSPRRFERRAWRLRLRPGKEGDYVRDHVEAPQEIYDLIAARGVHEYSIFVDGRDVFLYAEEDVPQREAPAELREAGAKWRERMNAIVEPEPKPRGRFMEECFHWPRDAD